MSETKFVVDLITFDDPDFWGVERAEQIAGLAARDRKAFWNKMLDALAESGVKGGETSSPPLDFRTALLAYGDLAGVKAAFETRDVDSFMLLTDQPDVGFCPDSAHLLLCGGDPMEIFDRYRDRVVLSH